MEIEVRVAGIPAIARVDSVHHDGDGWNEPRTVEVNYVLLDRRGRRARWLDAKVTSLVDESIIDQILAALD